MVDAKAAEEAKIAADKKVADEAKAAAEQEQMEEDIEFFVKREDGDPPEIVLEKLLKQYAIKVYEAKNKDPQSLKAVDQLAHLISGHLARVDAATKSENLQVKAAALAVKENIAQMVDKYNDLNLYLKTGDKQPSATNDKKLKSKSKIKKVKKKIKSVFGINQKAKATEISTAKSKTLLDLINALRNETHKRTTKISAKLASSEPKAAALSEDNIGIEFEESAPQNDKVVPTAELPVKAKSAAASPVGDSSEVAELKQLQNLLSDPKTRNQNRMIAMKKGVSVFKDLPKEKLPTSFGDIVKRALSIAEDSTESLIHKEAAKTILAVVVSPNATLTELTSQNVRIQEKIAELKKTQPMTPAIEIKIALREGVLKYINDVLAKKSADSELRAQAQQASKPDRAIPITPTMSASVPVSKKASLNVAEAFAQCVDDLQKLIENINEPENKKLFQEGVQPKVTLTIILTELKRLDPNKATAEDIVRLISRAEKYWNNDASAQKGNPLVKLRDQLPSLPAKGIARPSL